MSENIAESLDFEAPLTDEQRRRIEAQLRALAPLGAEKLGVTATVHVIEGRGGGPTRPRRNVLPATPTGGGFLIGGRLRRAD